VGKMLGDIVIKNPMTKDWSYANSEVFAALEREQAAMKDPISLLVQQASEVRELEALLMSYED
jgi:hypothetical protein